MPYHDGLGMLLDCMRSVWEGPEDAASCAYRFLAGVGGSEQEQLRRLLSFVEALRDPLLDRLEGKDSRSGGGGTLIDASRKRTRCDAESDQAAAQSEAEARCEAGANDEARPAFPGPSGTTAAALLPEAVQEGVSRAMRAVLLDQNLLACVWGFMLGGNGRQDVRVLGQLSLVCRKWREAGAWDGWWRAIEEDMLPVLWEEEVGQAASSRGRVVEYGRFLEGQRKLFRGLGWGDDWMEGLEAHLEIFDGMDGLQMLSTRGPVSFYMCPATEEVVYMQFPDHPTRQSTYATFSAASRDPLGRFSTMREYLQREHGEGSCMCIRVTLRDMRTGRMAVICEQDRHGRPIADPPTHYDGYEVFWGNETRRDKLLGRLVHQVWQGIAVMRVVDQPEDVSPREELYYIEARHCWSEFEYLGIGESERKNMILDDFKGVLHAVLMSGPITGGGVPSDL